jgi:Uma2 family endonuclease
LSRQAKKFVTPNDYLALERKAEYKNEYFDGEIFAMVGASRRHNLITTNVVSELHRQLRGRPCEVYPSDMRVRIPSANVYTYPDAVVVCGEPRFEDEAVDTLLNPTVIVEVLSKSTASYDRTVKFGFYRTLESLAEYLLIAQDAFLVEHYVRQPDGRWMLTDIRTREGAVELDSIKCSLRLRDVYEKVEMD